MAKKVIEPKTVEETGEDNFDALFSFLTQTNRRTNFLIILKEMRKRIMFIRSLETKRTF